METDHRITTDILRSALALEFYLQPAQVKVKSFEVSEGCGKGENFACVMKAVEVWAEVEGEEKERRVSYMAKCAPVNEFRAMKLKESNIFQVEIAMYSMVIPALRRLDGRISAPLTFFADDDKGVILMEDLKKKGYFMLDKARGLEVVHVKLALEQLALLHATSFHLIETYPNGGLRKFKQDFPLLNTDTWGNADDGEMSKKFESMVNKDLFISIVEEHCKENKHLVQKMRRFAETQAVRLRDLHPPKGNFNCILHNDAWCNNLLFGKNDAGNVDKVKLLDLQMCRRARPTIDLAYFFGTSTTPEFRRDNLDDMLQFYHDNLVRCLETLGHDRVVYTYEQLRRDYLECYAFGYCLSQVHTMMHLTPADCKDALLNIEEITDEESLARAMSKFRVGQLKLSRVDERMRNRLISIALEAEEMGVI